MSTASLSVERAAGEWRALTRLAHTDDSAIPTILRIGLGVLMFPHGAQKALGWFGGHGFTGTMGYFTGVLHLPTPLAFLVIVAEFVGSLALIAGALTRVAAMGVGCVMVGAIAMAHLPHGFFMNWFGSQAGEGFEYHLLVLTLVSALLVAGGGRGSVDRRITTGRITGP
jgi:putative oxidoreductase